MLLFSTITTNFVCEKISTSKTAIVYKLTTNNHCNYDFVGEIMKKHIQNGGSFILKISSKSTLNEHIHREQLILTRLMSKSNIYKVFDKVYDSDTGVYGFIMDCLYGTPLDIVITENKKKSTYITNAKFARILFKLLASLKIIHNFGIAHCDIKPANILLDDGYPMIIDFGLSEMILCREIDKHIIKCKGTPLYMNLTRFMNITDYSELYKSDIYALGVVAYELRYNNCYYYDINNISRLKIKKKDKMVLRSEHIPTFELNDIDALIFDMVNETPSIDSCLQRLRKFLF